MSGGYAVASTAKSRRIPRITHSNRLGRAIPIQTIKSNKMKMSIKQRIRNWLMNDDDTPDPYSIDCLLYTSDAADE